MRVLVFSLIFGLSPWAWSQSVEGLTGATLGLQLSWDSPNSTTPNGGAIDCTEATSSCRPLNLAACEDELGGAREIEATLRQGTATVLPTAKVYVWLQKETNASEACAYTETNRFAYLIGSPISVLETMLVSGELRFPEDYAQDFVLTVEALLNASGELTSAAGVIDDACGEAGIERVYRLCFGVDNAGATVGAVPDGVIDANDPTAYLRITVDTVRPASPESLVVTELDGRLRLTPKLAGDAHDGDVWQAHVRPLEDEASAAGDDCAAWPDTEASATATAASSGVEIAARNGRLYEGCLYLKDRAGNKSASFVSFVGRPLDQCDFIECFPGTPPSGCAAAPGAATCAVLLLLGARRLRRRS